MRSLVLACAALALAGCGGVGSSNTGAARFGLTQRVPVQGLAFPIGLPQPGALQVERAFPNLGFNRPLSLTAPPDGTNRLFVVEQGGRIHVFLNDPMVAATTVFLDISSANGGAVSRAGNEEGLLGLAFHPDYPNNGLFYVYYSVANPRRSRLSRFSVSANPDVADAGSEQILLEFNQPFSNHNGGCLNFGPDRMLYVSSGDGGSGNDPQNNAQNLGTLLGKILRLAPDGSIPGDNPFVNTPGARAEIWAYGVRNPWRFSFDRNTGDLWAGDVGQNEIEEVDLIRRGLNYGWRIYEGDRSNLNPDSLPPTAFEQPVQTYPHSQGVSITGGYVYRGALLPSLAGAYLYADFGSNRVWALVWDGNQVISNMQVASVPSPASFGEDQNGEVYVCSFDGSIYRFTESGPPAPAFPQQLSASGLFADTAALRPAPGVIEYDVNAPLWSDGARKRRWMALPGTARIRFEATLGWEFPVGTVLVKHFELDLSPTESRRLETRVLVLHSLGWQGYTYRWNAAQTDADLLAGAQTEDFSVEDPQAPGGRRDQSWYYPSRADCRQCHTGSRRFVLGARTRQLNRDFDYPAMTDNQLRAWNHIGLFDRDIGASAQYEALPDPLDPAAPLAARARAYLSANCAMCHNPLGTTPANIDLRFGFASALMNTHNVTATGGGGILIQPGRKESSVVWLRTGRLDATRMPPLASSVVDAAGHAVIGQWIDAGAGD